MKRKLVLILTCVVALSLIMSGCGTVSPAAQTQAATTTAVAAATAAPAAPTQIKFMHWWAYVTDSYMSAFKTDNPNITLQMDYVAKDQYDNKLKMLAASNDMPDVVGVQQPLYGELVKQNKLMDLTDALKTDAYDKKQAWGDTQTPSLMENMKSGLNTAIQSQTDKVYGVPFGAVAVAVVYNKSIYAKVGITAPKTFDEFLSNNDKLKAAGYIPMSFVGKFAWDSWWYRIAASQFMPDVKADDFASGKAKFTDPNFIKGLSLVQDMWKKGHFDPGGFTNGAEETQTLFVQGKLAQYLVVPENFVTYLMNNVPKDVALDAFVLPAMSPNGKNLAIGGASNVVAVRADTKASDSAIKLAKYMTSEKMYQQLAPEGVVPSTTGYTPPAGNTVMKAFADAMAPGFFVDNTPIMNDSKLLDKMEKDLMPRMLLKNEAPDRMAAELQAQYEKDIKK